MIKKILSFILLISVIIGIFSGCAKNSSETLNLYIWGEYLPNGSEGYIDVIAEFKREYGINVSVTNFASNEEMYAKIKSGSSKYDLIVPSDYMIHRMISEDMIEKLDFSNIPNYNNIMAEFKNPNYDSTGEYSVPYLWGLVGLVYNKSFISDEIKSWDALWDEKYSGNILMFDNSRDAFGIALRYLNYSQNTTDISEIQQAAGLLRKQQPLVQSYVMDQIYDKMENNEAYIAPYYAGDAYTMMEVNPDLTFVLPEEGTNRFVDAMVIPKGSKMKRQAEMLINFIIDEKISKEISLYTNYSTPNKLTYDSLPDEIKNNTNIYPHLEYLNSKTQSFLGLPFDLSLELDRLWIEIKSNIR